MLEKHLVFSHCNRENAIQTWKESIIILRDWRWYTLCMKKKHIGSQVKTEPPVSSERIWYSEKKNKKTPNPNIFAPSPTFGWSLRWHVIWVRSSMLILLVKAKNPRKTPSPPPTEHVTQNRETLKHIKACLISWLDFSIYVLPVLMVGLGFLYVTMPHDCSRIDSSVTTKALPVTINSQNKCKN